VGVAVKLLWTGVLLFQVLGGVTVAVCQEPKPPSESSAEKKAAAPADSKKPARSRVITDLSGFELTDKEKLNTQPMVVGATRGPSGSPSPPIPLGPQLAKVYQLNPSFVWSEKRQNGTNTFVLTDDRGKELFRSRADGSSFRYPSSAPSLRPGDTYEWRIETVVTGEVLSSTSLWFLIVGGDERQRITNALAGIAKNGGFAKALARARIFTEYRVWYDAIDSYSHLIGEYPEHPELYDERGMIYAQIPGTQELANKDFARADELRKDNRGNR
jgi:hypothetical protein